jgi:hypothetical protein
VLDKRTLKVSLELQRLICLSTICVDAIIVKGGRWLEGQSGMSKRVKRIILIACYRSLADRA